MRKLALYTFPLLASTQVSAVEFLNIDNAPQTWSANVAYISSESDLEYSDSITKASSKSDSSTARQMVFGEYRNDIYRFGFATGSTESEEGSDESYSSDIAFKAGVILQATDGAAAAIQVIGTFHDDNDYGDQIEYRFSAGRHLTRFSGEVNISHYQLDESDATYGFSMNELGFQTKYVAHRYVNLLTFGSTVIANDVNQKDNEADVDQLAYYFGVGIGSDPLPNLEVVLTTRVGNVDVKAFDTDNEEIANLDDDFVSTTLNVGYYF